jgi:glucosamine-6-phosphate deaminase
MSIKINYCGSYEELSGKAAQIVAEELAKKPDLVLGLPTGSTPVGMYKKLIELNRNAGIDFSQVRTFNLDEYYPIKRDDEQSYYKFMFDNFFGGVNIRQENISIPDGEAADPDAECAEYDRKIDAAGGIDLMILGIGANGHIGFNEPGEYLISCSHVAGLSEDTIRANARFFASPDEVPKKALTMGMGSIIAKSRKILLLVSGEAKAPVFREFLSSDKISADNPATFFAPARRYYNLKHCKRGALKPA